MSDVEMIKMTGDIFMYHCGDVSKVYRVVAVAADLTMVRIRRVGVSATLDFDYTLDDLLDEYSPVPMFGLKAANDMRIAAVIGDLESLFKSVPCVCVEDVAATAVMHVLELVEAGEL